MTPEPQAGVLPGPGKLCCPWWGEAPAVTLGWLCAPVLGSALSTSTGGVSDHIVWETLGFRAPKDSVPEMPASWEAEEFSGCGPHGHLQNWKCVKFPLN